MLAAVRENNENRAAASAFSSSFSTQEKNVVSNPRLEDPKTTCGNVDDEWIKSVCVFSVSTLKCQLDSVGL